MLRLVFRLIGRAVEREFDLGPPLERTLTKVISKRSRDRCWSKYATFKSTS